MYGENGKTEEVQLRNKTDNFERAAIDKFKVSDLLHKGEEEGFEIIRRD